METYFEFEKPIASLEQKLQEMRDLSQSDGVDLQNKIKSLEQKIYQLIENTFAGLKPWEKVQLSRHPNRPYMLDYIERCFTNFRELHGDRSFSDDAALVTGMAEMSVPGQKKPQTVLVVGHQKGRNTKQKMKRNFGMARPEGYRKAIRLMELANRSKLPIITFIDTPGAYPSVDAEERGQSQAIAESITKMFELDVPIISVVIGEGGSGGALAIGIGNRVLMQEFSTYSVISPEGCASILWADPKMSERASEALRMSPSALTELGVVDGVIKEPIGGAHRSWNRAAESLQTELGKHLGSLLKSKKDLRKERLEKFRKLGQAYLAATQGSSEAPKRKTKTATRKTAATKKKKTKKKTKVTRVAKKKATASRTRT